MVEGSPQSGRRQRLDRCDALGGLNGQGRDGRGSEEAVGGENLEIGGDAGAVGWIKTGDGEGDRGFRCVGSLTARQRGWTADGIVL